MRSLTAAGEIMSVIGTIGLLGLWLYQQTEIQQRSKELSEINSARSIYQTYQSNNAIFNALRELTPKKDDSAVIKRIFSIQIYNYELGLVAMEKLLPDSEKKEMPVKIAPYNEIENVSAALATTQKRLEFLQTKMDEKEETVSSKSAQSLQKYFWGYILFSVISVTGAIFKISHKKSGAG